MKDPLEPLARQIEDDPFFLGSLLALYALSHNLDETALAEWLGCPPGEWSAFKLCRSPRDGDPQAGDLQQVAERFGVTLDRLTSVVRHARVLQRMRGQPSRLGEGTLLAAREDEKPQENPS